LSRAFALSVPHERAIAVRDDVGFFQTVRAALAKTVTTGGRDEEDLNAAVARSSPGPFASDRVIDIFSPLASSLPKSPSFPTSSWPK